MGIKIKYKVTEAVTQAGELTAKDIPTSKKGGFNEFFNSLTSEELDELWENKSIRKKIERIKSPRRFAWVAFSIISS